MKQAIIAAIEADAALAALLTGGVHGAVEISRQTTPTAFDGNQEILPCALVKVGTVVPTGPHHHAAQQGVDIYLYHPNDYTALGEVADLLFKLLHRQKLTPASGTCWQLQHDTDTGDEEDSALKVPMKRCRFIAYIGRPR